VILDKSRKLVDSPSKDADCDPQRNPTKKGSAPSILTREGVFLLAFIIRLSITAFLALYSAIPADGGNTVAFDFALSTWIARSCDVFSGRFRI